MMDTVAAHSSPDLHQ